MITTDNINKLSYSDIFSNINEEKGIIINSLLKLKDKPIKEISVNSRWCDKYYILKVNEGRYLIYSITGLYIAIWPIEYILTGIGDKNIIYVKKHVIARYNERYLHEVGDFSETVLKKFLEALFQNREDEKNFIVIKEKTKLSTVSIRFKDGALLGFIYDVAPNIIRLNTFVSDVELLKANRKDQIVLLRKET